MSDSMLSQEEVDALFKQATGKAIVHAPSSAPSEKPVAKPYVAQAAAAKPAAAPPPAPAPAPQAAAVATAPKPAPAAAPVAAAPPPAPASVAKPAAPPVQEMRPKPAVPPPPAPVSSGVSDAVVTQLEEMVSELTIRLARAERQIAEMEANKRPPPNMATTKDLARLNALVESMSKKLDATPGYNARNLFTCSECGTPGEISVPVKCNHCGQEGWWGWFPKEDNDE